MGYVNSNWEIKINKKKTITNKRWIGQPTLFHMGIIELHEKKKTEMDWACTNLHIVEIILKKKSDVGKYFIWYKYMLQRYDNSAWYWC